MRQPIDHLGTPILFGLSRQNVAADLPVQTHEKILRLTTSFLWGDYSFFATPRSLMPRVLGYRNQNILNSTSQVQEKSDSSYLLAIDRHARCEQMAAPLSPFSIAAQDSHAAPF